METTANPIVKVGDILKVTNVGTKLFRGAWDLVDYVISPGMSDYLPFEAVKLFFGDPRAAADVKSARDSRGIVEFLPDRAREVARLRLLYSHGFGDFTGKEGPDIVWDTDKIPHMKVETLQGNRVWTVIDDPAGTSVMMAVTTQADDIRLREIVEQQGKLIRSLMDRVGINSMSDLANPGLTVDPGPATTATNIYDPETDEIRAAQDVDPTADPEIYDELPEDR